MSKKKRQSSSSPRQTHDASRLKVWAEHRKEPDWDRYIAVLIAMALAELDEERKERKRD